MSEDAGLAQAHDPHGVPSGTVMTAAFAQVLARDVCWGWPIVNAFHRRASFAAAPEPGLIGGVLPAAPTGRCRCRRPTQRWVAHPNQDVVYGFGYGAVDEDPVLLQVPDFGDRFWVYALYDARSDEFSTLGRQYDTKPGNYLVVGPTWDAAVPDGIAGVLRSPTELVAMGPRVFLDDTPGDLDRVREVLGQVVIYPLSIYTVSQPLTGARYRIFRPASQRPGKPSGSTRRRSLRSCPRSWIWFRRYRGRSPGTP